MRLLLDTHIWLWYLLGNDRLSNNFQVAIANTTNELWLSPVSIWETLVLADKGRLALTPTPFTWVKKHLRLLNLQEARLSHDIAILSRQLEILYQDPADRFIAATAVHLDLILATVDTRLICLSWLQTIQ